MRCLISSHSHPGRQRQLVSPHGIPMCPETSSRVLKDPSGHWSQWRDWDSHPGFQIRQHSLTEAPRRRTEGFVSVQPFMWLQSVSTTTPRGRPVITPILQMRKQELREAVTRPRSCRLQVSGPRLTLVPLTPDSGYLNHFAAVVYTEVCFNNPTKRLMA